MVTFLAGPAVNMFPPGYPFPAQASAGISYGCGTGPRSVCLQRQQAAIFRGEERHPTRRAVIAPSHTETKPTTKLRTTFSPAIRNSPAGKMRNVSYSKVENVLYPPMKPIGIRYPQ